MNSQINFLLNKSLESLGSSNLELAELYLKQALRLQSNNPHVLRLLGVVSAQREDYFEALKYLNNSLKVFPKNSATLSNLGNVYLELNEYDKALDHYSKSIKIDLKNYEAWYNKGIALHKLKRYEEAISNYDKALSLKPNYESCWSNKGLTLYELKRYEEAITSYEIALSLKPEYAEWWFNKGNALHQLEQFNEAIECYDKALSLRANYAESWANKGSALYDLKRYEEAIVHYDKALKLKPNLDWLFGNIVYSKMKICDWSDLSKSSENIFKKVAAKERVVHPFIMLSLNDNNSLHKISSEIYAQNKYPINSSLGLISKTSKKDKIRLGYFSPDFRNHPVSLLTSELYEIHDRDKFEVFAFSLQKAPIGDEINMRLKKSFDRFIDVHNMSDLGVAKLARELGIDIAIDLAGPTTNSRTRIFSYRTAPIQVNWLGYPGTIGADFIDYIVADRTIIPESDHQFYTEKVVYLPDTYMVDDSSRITSSRIFTRAECGLPQNAFIFCCFNNDYKFNPQVIESWIRILHSVKNSILWIPENNKYFMVNITTQFEIRGIDRSRLFFAQREELMGDHLARHCLADLFLDTHPYNAHTTALDSLKSGTPVITQSGHSFASRVAASLLRAIGLPELITTRHEDYEMLAVELATNPEKLAAIKEKLAYNLRSTALFDTSRFTRNLENAYIEMYERYQADLEPSPININ